MNSSSTPDGPVDSGPGPDEPTPVSRPGEAPAPDTEPAPDQASAPEQARPTGAGGLRLYSAHNRIFNGLGMLGGAVVAGVVASAVHAWPVRVVAALISLGLFAWAVRGALVGVICTADRVVVRELTRTHRLPWGDVLGVSVRVDPRFKITAPAFMVYADEAHRGRRGGRVSAMSLADKRRRVVEEYVRTLTDQWEAHVADSSG